ncbi:MAG: alpha/beta fold hydrolase [Deltaproteobacteria bacterium]|nr:alpha/beta fold hydrolase [Deltaproteobacteria bacterium]
MRSDASPASWLVLTHGIYGTGANLRGVARKLHEARPDWGVVLVDLRLHGRSTGGDPPHTVQACAEDLAALVAELGDVGAIAGHSFGGKVALATRPLARPRQTWILDASPSARPGALDATGNVVADMLALMERLPKTWARREDFVAEIVARGHAASLGQWLAMNLARAGDELVLQLDLAGMRQLLESYYATDLWSELVRPDGDVELVIAERSNTLDAADRARLAQPPPHVHVHGIDAGHWLHVEAPAAVVDLFARRLPR